MWLKFHFQMQQRPNSQIAISPTPRVWLCHQLMIPYNLALLYMSYYGITQHTFVVASWKWEFIGTMKPSPLFLPKPITIIRTQPLFFTQTPKFTSNVKPKIFQSSPHRVRLCSVSMSTRSVHSSSPVIESDVQRPDSYPPFVNSTEEHIEKVLATTLKFSNRMFDMWLYFLLFSYVYIFMYVCIYVNAGYLWMSFHDVSGSLGVFSWIVFMFYKGMAFSFHGFTFWHC